MLAYSLIGFPVKILRMRQPFHVKKPMGMLLEGRVSKKKQLLKSVEPPTFMKQNDKLYN